MSAIFRLPDLGEGLTEAELVQWLVAVGDTIRIDQAIAEVETAKSVVELPSPFAGTVRALHGASGDMLIVGEPVIEIDDGSDAAATAELAPAEPGPGTDDTAAEPAEPHAPAAGGDVELEAHRAEEQAGSGNVLIGYGTTGSRGAARRRPRLKPPGSRVTASVPTPEPAAGSASETAVGVPEAATLSPRVRVRSPQLRRVARDLGVDLSTVVPTGADDTVTRADILRAAEIPAAGSPAAGSSTTASADEAGATASVDPVEIGRDRLGMLRRTASARLTRSRTEIPEATVWVDVDATRLWELRPELAPQGERPPSLTALLARFTLLALAEYPLLASRLSEDGTEIIRFAGVNLGIAADTERGLLVPVVPRADELSIAELDVRLRELAAEARGGNLAPEKLRGSTFTLNNYGSLGVDGSAAIINHPEVAILGVGRMIERPWVVDGVMMPRRIVTLSLVFDHRICDGGYAAGFLRHIVGAIENPLSHYTRL